MSYAWECEEHRTWVYSFATRLRKNGVDVVLHQWDWYFGDNRLLFMERVASVDSVLIICTPGYASSTSELADKQKVIPVLRLGDWISSVPVLLKHASGPDLSGDPYSEEQFGNLLETLHRKRYENLLRTLQRKLVEAPTLGPIPLFNMPVDIDEAREMQISNAVRAPLSAVADADLSVQEHELLDAAVDDPMDLDSI